MYRWHILLGLIFRKCRLFDGPLAKKENLCISLQSTIGFALFKTSTMKCGSDDEMDRSCFLQLSRWRPSWLARIWNWGNVLDCFTCWLHQCHWHRLQREESRKMHSTQICLGQPDCGSGLEQTQIQCYVLPRHHPWTSSTLKSIVTTNALGLWKVWVD